MKRVLTNEFYTVTPFCILMTILNFYYLVTRITKLDKKHYHVMMFSILQLVYTMLALSKYFKLSAYSIQVQMILQTTDSCMEKPLTVFAVCLSLFWGLNTFAHCIFIMKYWVLSFKMQTIT